VKVPPVVGPTLGPRKLPDLTTKMTGTDEVKVSSLRPTVPEIVPTTVPSTVMSSSNSFPCGLASTSIMGSVPSGQSVRPCALAGEEKTPSVASVIIATMAISTSAIQYGLVVVTLLTEADPLP
jgi:hypothetical protein